MPYPDTQRLSQAPHPPRLVMSLPATLTSVSLVSGYVMGMEKRDWFLTILFVALMASSFTVILDLEYPRLGFISLDSVEAELVSIRKGMWLRGQLVAGSRCTQSDGLPIKPSRLIQATAS
jgi:hypothetical protein